MNQTNGDSKRQDNQYVCGGQIIPTEKELEVPPTAYKQGPTVINVKLEEVMTIKVEDSKLNENGELECNGKTYKIFSKEAFQKLKENRATRMTKNKEKVISAEKVEAKRKARKDEMNEKIVSETELTAKRQASNVEKASGDVR